MNTLISQFKRARSRIAHAFFLRTKILQDRLHSGRSLKILFSDNPKTWQNDIRKSFRFSKHQVAFQAFSPESIRQHALVVALNVADLKYLDENRNLLVNNAITIPSLPSVRLCDDKYFFNQTLTAKGFGNFIPKISDPMTYPYILKKKTGEWGENCFIIHDSEHEQKYAEHLQSEDFFTQEIIAGNEEFATHILHKGGRILCSLNIRYTFDTTLPIKGQDKRFYREVAPCPYMKEFADILNAIEFEGLCCFNYKVRDGQPMILEINPRFGGSLRSYFISFIRHLG